MIVVDTNVISYLLIPSPLTTAAVSARRRDDWCAPLLWRSEFRSVLALRMRHHALSRQAAGELISLAERLLWGREFSVRSATVLDCVSRSTRSAYDCEFVALAEDLGTRLVTTDEPLVRDFPNRVIHLQDYVAQP